MPKYATYKQLDAMDCGATCLRMISKFYGRSYPAVFLREKCHTGRDGVSLLGISDAAESIGFRTAGVKITLEQLANEATLPCILHWDQKHFVVLYDVKKYKGKYTFTVAHRLSTVKNADKIVVLNKGVIRAGNAQRTYPSIFDRAKGN